MPSQRTQQSIVGWTVVLLVLTAEMAAGSTGLNSTLQAYVERFLQFVMGCGTIIFMLGLGSSVYQWISVPNSPLLGNSLTIMVFGGFFGGAPAIALKIGLIGGALLP
jgi:hypothetical protein